MVAPGVRRLVAPNPGLMTGEGTNTFVFGEGEVAIVDPGPADDGHVEAILGALPSGARVAAILVTHGHADHAGAVEELRARSGAPVYGHPMVTCVSRPIGDTDVLDIGGIAVEALATPGHADEHLCFWMPARRVLFSGDLVVGSGTVVLSETPGALGRYLASLERLLGLAPFMLLPGHGPVVRDGAGKVAEYIAHRDARERQIVAALTAGARSVEEIVGRVYPDTPPGLKGMAGRNVRAHLERLTELGQAWEDAGLWRRKT